MDKIITIGGRRYINTTPHAVTFGVVGSDETIDLPPSGWLVNAKPKEELVSSVGGVEYVRTVFEMDSETEKTLSELPSDVIVIGSLIAAQAYAGRVVAMVACPGFERVPPDQKRMRLDKFTIF